MSVDGDLNLISSLSSSSTRPSLRATLALESVEPLARILLSSSSTTTTTTRNVKLALSGFATSYPYLFRHACQSRPNDEKSINQWSRVVQIKTQILSLSRNNTQSESSSFGAIKCIQRIIQTQTSASSDPRLANRGGGDINLNLCRSNHPFLKISHLEEESNKLLQELITTLFTKNSSDLLSSIVTCLIQLIKQRPQFTKLVITALTNWSPSRQFIKTNSYSQTKSLEKLIRISLNHLLKSTSSTSSSYHQEINQFFTNQAKRLESALMNEKKRIAQFVAPPPPTTTTKRRKLNDDPPPPTIDLLRAFGSANLNLSINLATDIPVVIDYYPSHSLVVDHLMEIFTEIPKDKLERSIELVRDVLPPRNNNNNQDELIKQEEEEKDVDVDVVRVVDPLKLDLGEEELTMKAEVPPPLPLEPSRQQQQEEAEEEPQQAELQVELSLIDNENDDLVPLDLSLVAKRSVIETTLKRICYGGTLDDNSSVAAVNERIWVTLITRLITRRSKNDDDRLREILFEFVMKDFENRFELARLWLNEEWYTRTSSRYYDLYLSKFFDHIMIIQDSNDFASKNLFKFMIDLPSLPLQELKKFEQMCLSESDLMMPLGFNMLRELTRLRPSREIRFNTLDILLGLTTHSDKRIRNAAIMSVKKWVPEVEQLSRIIVDFALSLLQRLKVEPPQPPQPEIKPEGEEQEEEEEEEMEIDDGETPEPAQAVLPFGLVRQGKVVDRLPPPQTIGQVTQHVELLLALCVKQPELLQPLFEEYPRMTLLCRESLQELITPLIRSLGIKHVGIVGLFENFPPGSDLLLLKLVEILADKQKLPNDLVQRIKDVAKTRELDSKLYALIMPDCHKEEILKYLPKVVGLLDSSSRQKASIRSIFLSIIQPPQHFSAVNSLRSRSDSISPVELMTFLHKHDREIGIKQTIEAIAICFSMADAFRPEILAAFMQQIVDKESVLPNLFLRTVIQSVTTYKSLQPFVSTTLLSRLISKKIWEHPQLWQGFIRCAKVIMPSSFAALLQLPKEWLKDLIEKQPSMRQPLKEYVLKKGGVVNAKTTAILEVLNEEEGGSPPATRDGSTPTPTTTSTLTPPITTLSAGNSNEEPLQPIVAAAPSAA